MAISNPCALLDRLIEEPHENEWLEFKVNNADPHELGEYVSALANAAMMSNKDRAFLVLGVDDKTRRKLGTIVRLSKLKKGGENFINWLCRLTEPRLMIEFLDFDCEGLNFSILAIEPSYDRPVRFDGVEYIRIGENKKKLIEFPHHERALWMLTGRRKFEAAIAMTNQTPEHVLEKIDPDTFYTLSGEPKPKSAPQIIRKLESLGAIKDNLEGGFDITNLGALLFARDITLFPSISTKAVRIVKYSGDDRRKTEFEQEGRQGYASGFVEMMKFIMERLPKEERYIGGVRRSFAYPEVPIREVIANALIHQDFMVSGAGPIIELFANRIEVANPGSSLIEPDRMLDERQSRNEKLAATMRGLGLCEERGGGLDKALMAIEQASLPAPEFISSKNSMRVVLFGPKAFGEMSKAEKQRACFYHCVLRWLLHDYMSNTTLRERFSLSPEDYQAVSAVITEAVRTRRIAPADPNQGKRNAKYIPYWAV